MVYPLLPVSVSFNQSKKKTPTSDYRICLVFIVNAMCLLPPSLSPHLIRLTTKVPHLCLHQHILSVIYCVWSSLYSNIFSILPLFAFRLAHPYPSFSPQCVTPACLSLFLPPVSSVNQMSLFCLHIKRS